jgi:hypothetical protein
MYSATPWSVGEAERADRAGDAIHQVSPTPQRSRVWISGAALRVRRRMAVALRLGRKAGSAMMSRRAPFEKFGMAGVVGPPHGLRRRVVSTGMPRRLHERRCQKAIRDRSPTSDATSAYVDSIPTSWMNGGEVGARQGLGRRVATRGVDRGRLGRLRRIARQTGPPLVLERMGDRRTGQRGAHVVEPGRGLRVVGSSWVPRNSRPVPSRATGLGIGIGRDDASGPLIEPP